MSSVQKSLTDQWTDQEIDDISEERWRELYNRYDGHITKVSTRVGHTWKAVHKRLIEFGIHEPNTSLEYQLLRTRPQDIGLSPLNCGRCGKQEIMDHPCPECGFDPSGGED